MFSKLKSAQVNILFDLDELYRKYGSYNTDEVDPANVRYFLDAHRTEVLRNIMYSLIPSPAFKVSSVNEMLSKEGSDSKEDIEEYLKDILTDSDSATDDVPYYMELSKSTVKPNLFFMNIVLKCNFFNYIKENPSERIKMLLQEILEILYENNIVDKTIVGHYMTLCLQGTNTFEKNLIKFLGETK